MKFGIIHLIYATTLIAASTALGGILGSVWAIFVLTICFFVFRDSSGPRENSETPTNDPKISIWEVLLILTVSFCLLGIALPPTPPRLKRASHRAVTMNKMRQLMLGVLNYESANGNFPPAYIADKNGKPMHSWRVLILPFIEEQAVFAAYDFDEPWDGPNNSKLVDKLNDPGVFTNGFDDLQSKCTLKLVTGPGTAFPSDRKICFSDLKSGSSNTIAMVDDRRNPINWMAPDDVTIAQAVDLFDPASQSFKTVQETKFEKITSSFSSVAFLDSSAHSIFPLKNPEDIRDHFTIDSPPKISIDDLEYSPNGTETKIKLDGFLLVGINCFLFFLPWLWARKRKRFSKVAAE